MKGFGQRLRDRTDALGVADSTVAARAGLSQQRYHNYSADLTEPDFETLLRICAALDTTPNRLLGSELEAAQDGEPGVIRSRILAALGGMGAPMLHITAAVVETLAKQDQPAPPLKAARIKGRRQNLTSGDPDGAA